MEDYGAFWYVTLLKLDGSPPWPSAMNENQQRQPRPPLWSGSSRGGREDPRRIALARGAHRVSATLDGAV